MLKPCLLFVHSQMRQHLHFPTSYLLHCDVLSVFLYILCCTNIAAKGDDVSVLPEKACLLIIEVKNEVALRENWVVLFFFAALRVTSRIFGFDKQEVSIRGGGLLMLYQLAEGERQRRPRPIQRPQSNSSRMPSIPMCCVKVEPAESSERAFLMRATLCTHRQSSGRPV